MTEDDMDKTIHYRRLENMMHGAPIVMLAGDPPVPDPAHAAALDPKAFEACAGYVKDAATIVTDLLKG